MKLNFLLFAAVLAFSSSKSMAADGAKLLPTPAKMLGSEGGRFVFGQINDIREDRFMVDTKTGRVWQLVVSRSLDKDGKPIPNSDVEVLTPVLYKDYAGNIGVLPLPVVKAQE